MSLLIAVGASGIEWPARQYPEAPVGYIPANHEFYGHDACDTESAHFLGRTLRTEFKLYGKGEAWFSRRIVLDRMHRAPR